VVVLDRHVEVPEQARHDVMAWQNHMVNYIIARFLEHL